MALACGRARRGSNSPASWPAIKLPRRGGEETTSPSFAPPTGRGQVCDGTEPDGTQAKFADRVPEIGGDKPGGTRPHARGPRAGRRRPSPRTRFQGMTSPRPHLAEPRGSGCFWASLIHRNAMTGAKRDDEGGRPRRTGTSPPESHRSRGLAHVWRRANRLSEEPALLKTRPEKIRPRMNKITITPTRWRSIFVSSGEGLKYIQNRARSRFTMCRRKSGLLRAIGFIWITTKQAHRLPPRQSRQGPETVNALQTPSAAFFTRGEPQPGARCFIERRYWIRPSVIPTPAAPKARSASSTFRQDSCTRVGRGVAPTLISHIKNRETGVPAGSTLRIEFANHCADVRP